MNQLNILWVDDEIELLKPHILFLEQHDYKIKTFDNGNDALDALKESVFDIVFLDENMPGLSGLDVLLEIKQIRQSVPVVMITKSDEEFLMDEAIGSKISDYLIKPVNPKQILLSLKRLLDHPRLISEKSTLTYQQTFQTITADIAIADSYQDWTALYEKLVYWELQLETIEDQAMLEVLKTQKQEANSQFGKFIEKNYAAWFSNNNGPLFSHQIFRKKIAPVLKETTSTLVVVIDNLRLDQWNVIEPLVNNHYQMDHKELYFSLLPTATQYARNAFFAGLTPLEIKTKYPKYWKQDYEEGGKNEFEKELLDTQLARLALSNLKTHFQKITTTKSAIDYERNFRFLKENHLNVLVYNFIDVLSHAKTDSQIIKELASDDKAYRSITRSWFLNSPLLRILQQARELNMALIITTDHGTINVNQPSKVIGDKQTSSNLRYKTGRSLSYTAKEVFEALTPNAIQLPNVSINSAYIFAKEQYFFAYPNNYNHFVNYYKDTYQHGGISLEEMIIPFVSLTPKK